MSVQIYYNLREICFSRCFNTLNEFQFNLPFNIFEDYKLSAVTNIPIELHSGSSIKKTPKKGVIHKNLIQI
jgi:hypothetical protein